eukprot:1393651-Pyramimonas_sp.AAC.1
MESCQRITASLTAVVPRPVAQWTVKTRPGNHGYRWHPDNTWHPRGIGIRQYPVKRAECRVVVEAKAFGVVS